MMQKFIMLITVVFLTELFSCSKPNGTDPVYFNPEFKSDFNYQVGSSWLFYDSLNKRYDTLKETYYEYFKPFYDGETPTEFVNITMTFYDSLTDTNTISLGPQLSAPYSYGLFFIYNSQSGGGIEYEYSSDLFYNIPFDTGKNTKRTYINNMQIVGVTYDSVYRIEYNNANLYMKDIYYINAKFGFLEIFFNNQYVHRNLYLIHSNVIK